ncbi:Tyrosine-protein kinase [Parasponia andersonii]|uniref:Tyrosine-protein kinase n=1 Tax=Parasponia andersonii TaxID=3476 RepID=A0A2P5B257_PARAD|nr:Tyrosine-protein kinase [Parasponia andersonii]
MLDQNYNAKISDFGLTKLGPSGRESHVTTRILGTYACEPPEYIATSSDDNFCLYEMALLFSAQ